VTPLDQQVEEPITIEQPQPGRSWQLTAVAVLFIVGGLSAAWDFGASGPLTIQRGGGAQSFHVNLGTLALPIGIGLLRYRPGWRIAGLVFSALLAGAALFGAILLLAGHGHLTVQTPGTESWPISDTWIGLLVMGFVAAVSAWILYVLLRPDTRRRFQDRLPDRPWIEWAALAGVLLLMYVV
jgi:hypothetical protein